MAVAAARDCLKGVDRATVGGAVLRLHHGPLQGEADRGHHRRRSWTCRRTRSPWTSPGSLRCGTNALKAALDAVASGSAESVLVLRRRHPPRLPRRARRDELRRRRRGPAGRRGRRPRRGQALRQPVLRDPGHLALGQGHLRPHGRGPLLHGRGLRRRDGPAACPRPSRSTGWPPRDVAHVALNCPQRAPAAGRRQEAALRRADPGQRRAARVGGRHRLRRCAC